MSMISWWISCALAARRGGAAGWISELVTWGAGPRAVQYLILGAKARAALHGSYLARIEDIQALAEPVLVHRILTNFHAESEASPAGEIIQRLLGKRGRMSRV